MNKATQSIVADLVNDKREKIMAIKLVRAVTGLGLKDAKEATEAIARGETVEFHGNQTDRAIVRNIVERHDIVGRFRLTRLERDTLERIGRE